MAQFTENSPIFSIYLRPNITKSFVKVIAIEAGRNFSDRSTWNGCVSKNIRWGHWVHATVIPSTVTTELVALRSTYEFLCAICRAVSTKRIPRLARDVSHRCDILATGICIRLPAISRSRCHLKDGIGNENDSSALSADRCNLTAIGIRLSKHFVTPEELRIL